MLAASIVALTPALRTAGMTGEETAVPTTGETTEASDEDAGEPH